MAKGGKKMKDRYRIMFASIVIVLCFMTAFMISRKETYAKAIKYGLIPYETVEEQYRENFGEGYKLLLQSYIKSDLAEHEREKMREKASEIRMLQRARTYRILKEWTSKIRRR
jgi:hypothetical protein